MGLFTIVFLVVIAGMAWMAFAWRRDVLTMRLEGREFYKDLKANDPKNPLSNLGRHQFMMLYERAYRIRKPKYMVLYLAMAMAGTVPVLMFLSVVRKYLYQGPIIWGFQIFFALILWWVGALAIVLWFYHRHQPGTLDEEFERARGE